MWTLNPHGVLKQLERSSLLPLLKDGVNGIKRLSVEGVKTSLQREKSRLNSLLGSTGYLDESKILLENFPDLKHNLGVVCSFKVAVQQLNRFREKQVMKIAAAVPISFISRCRMFTEFLYSVQKRLDPSLLGGFDKEIKMLKAVDYFDSSRALFDNESEICEKLYRIMRQEQQKEEGSSVVVPTVNTCLQNGDDKR